MSTPEQRQNSVRLKLNTVKSVFDDQNVMLVDDSIVRGTTSHSIVKMARASGARKIYFCSAAPPVLYPSVYGIDIAKRSELIAARFDNKNQAIANYLDIDRLIYLGLEDLHECGRECNPRIQQWEDSVFSGYYISEGKEYNQLLEILS